MAEFKPNLYPMMYWGLMYGVIGGFILVVINLLSQYITAVWFPVFLAGVIWGGYRNYLKQKKEAGSRIHKSVVDEFKSAAQDVMQATGEMLAENQVREPEEVIEEAEEKSVDIEVEDNSAPPTAPPPPQA